ncbi:MAG: TatD family hydrolase [Proteobacteria bacterium]|nr:TatD family hydrolase [Pseudomonadota bacterium]
MGLFDVHAHLTHPKLVPRIDGAIERARAAGLTSVISNGLNQEDNEAVQALASDVDLVRPAYGLYPVDAVLPEMLAAGVEYPRTASAATAEEAASWIRDHADEAIAVGEIGLDGHWVPEAFWERQEQVFRMFVQLALDADKPIIIHTRKRERRAFEVLQEMGVERADFHCFGSRVKLAVRIAQAGYFLSIPAHARKAESFQAMLRKAPRSQLLLETDCPYLSPDRDALPTNEPASVKVTAELSSELWGEPIEAVTEQFEDNYRRLFREDP